jgi:hypothetical protein
MLHGGALEHRLLARWQVVDPSGDQRLKRVRNPLHGGSVGLRKHAYRLLDEQRITLGLFEECSPCRRRQVVVRKQGLD